MGGWRGRRLDSLQCGAQRDAWERTLGQRDKWCAGAVTTMEPSIASCSPQLLPCPTEEETEALRRTCACICTSWV